MESSPLNHKCRVIIYGELSLHHPRDPLTRMTLASLGSPFCLHKDNVLLGGGFSAPKGGRHVGEVL